MARLTENLNLQRGLLQHLDKYPDVELRQRTKVTSISPDETGWPLVKLDDGTVIRARLLVSFLLLLLLRTGLTVCRLAQTVPILQSGIMPIFSRTAGRTIPKELSQLWSTLLAVLAKGQTPHRISDSSRPAQSPSYHFHQLSRLSFGRRNPRLRKPSKHPNPMFL